MSGRLSRKSTERNASFTNCTVFSRVAFGPAAQAVSEFLTRGAALQERLPPPSRRSEVEQAAADGLSAALTGARVAFLVAHADQLYDDHLAALRQERELP